MRTPPPAAFAALAAVLVACGRAAVPEPAPRRLAAGGAFIRGTPLIPPTWELAGKAVPVTGQHAMVVTAHPLASAAGVEVLRQGGNAVDAAVAVGFALAVVLPDAGNIGGGGFLLLREAGGAVHALDYRETAPAAASRDMYLDSTGAVTEQSVTGHLAVGVPGSVAGLHTAWKAHGRLPWAAVLAPAIRLARDGHVVDSTRAADIEWDAERLARFPASRAQFLPDSVPPPVGSVWTQPDLARTLQLISDSGPDAFYRGQIADLLVAEMAAGGGLVTKEDLAHYEAKWREPITLSYRSRTILSMPPASSGGVTLSLILNVLEGYDTLPAMGTPGYVHLLTEAMRRAFMDRNRWLGDPDFVAMPLERLLSKSYAAALRAGIDRAHATPTPPSGLSSDAGAHTTHYSIIDSAGNAVSVTTTLNGGFGSAVTVTGAGFLLNNEMDDFTAAPGQPNQFGLVQGEANAIAPGKRMLSAMTPSIVLGQDGQVELIVGTPGGPTIITTVAQVILDVVDQGMPLADAVEAPRVHHQALPDTIRFERGGLAPGTVAGLRGLGHAVAERRGTSGIVAAIARAPAGGWIGVADPRYLGGAAGY
jgi:gamma-glutamyltranspeptidase/glutathione hydrolase